MVPRERGSRRSGRERRAGWAPGFSRSSQVSVENGCAAQAWVTLVVGLTAITGVIITWRQKNDANRRSEWWRRIAWAYERVFGSDDTQQRLGWTLLKVLITSKLATRGDSDYVQAIAEHIALEEEVVTDGRQDILDDGPAQAHEAET